jgi:hypothetical protein
VESPSARGQRLALQGTMKEEFLSKTLWNFSFKEGIFILFVEDGAFLSTRGKG